VFRFLVEARGNPQKQKEYISSSLFLLLAAIGVFVLIAVPALNIAGYAYTKYLITSVVVNTLSALLLQIPRGCGDNKAYAVISCVSGSSHVLLNVLFIAVAKWGVDGMLRANILSHIITICLVVSQTKLWKQIALRCFRRKSIRELLTYSLPLVPGTFMWWIVNVSDRIIINFTMGVSPNGIYSVANKFASTYTLASNIFHVAWTESAAENIHDRDRNRFYQKVFDNLVRFYSSCCIGIIALVPFVFPFLVNTSFGDAFVYIPVLLIAAMAHSVTSFYGSIYLAFKKTKTVAKSTVLAAILNIVINLMLIRKIGLYAAALSTMVSYSVILVIRYYEIKKLADISISKTFLLREFLVYILVLISYYSNNRAIQAVTLLWLIPYCCVSNKQIIMAARQKFKNKLVK